VETPVHEEVWFIPALVLGGLMVIMLPTMLYMCCRVVSMTLEPPIDYEPPLALEYPGYSSGARSPVQQFDRGGRSGPPLMIEAGGGRHMMPLRGGGGVTSPKSHKVHPAGVSTTYDKV